MKHPGSILLISCYELGHQPVALASPLGFLNCAGYHPSALDLSVESLDPEKIRQAKFISLSVPMHTALRLGVRAVKEIQRINPNSHLCFYGLYAQLNADYLLQNGIDSVIGGEFEEPLLKLIQALEKNSSIHEVRGITTRQSHSGPYLERLPFVVPSRKQLPPLPKYARLEFQKEQNLVGSVEARRGCKHLCRHCPIPPVYEGRFFVVPQEIVLADIRQLVEAGARHIDFADPDFLNGPGHSLAIVRKMHQEFPHLTFDFITKIEHILKHREIFEELKNLGCLFVVSAVESLNDHVLVALKKGHTREEVFMAAKILKEAGITIRPSLVPFTPWESLDSYLDLLSWIEREDLIDSIDPVHFSIRLLIPPGSALLEEPEIQPFLSTLNESTFSYEWRHPDARMEELQKVIAHGVEEASNLAEEPWITFQKVKRLAYKFAGKEYSPFVPHSSSRDLPPHLTETWFCCAEPTEQQRKLSQI